MNARDIIATTAVDGRHEPIGLIHAEAIIAMLITSGYRILGPGERDAETLEAAATVASKYCWNRYREGGKLKTPAVFTSHTRDDLASAIQSPYQNAVRTDTGPKRKKDPPAYMASGAVREDRSMSQGLIWARIDS